MTLRATARKILELDAYSEDIDWRHVQRIAARILKGVKLRRQKPKKSDKLCKAWGCTEPKGKKRKIGDWDGTYSTCDRHRLYMREAQRQYRRERARNQR